MGAGISPPLLFCRPIFQTQVLHIWGRWTLAASFTIPYSKLIKSELRWTMVVSFTIPYPNQRNLSCSGHIQFPLQPLIKINEI